MLRLRTLILLIASAVVCAMAFLVISNMTIVPLVAKGSGPEGVQVTTSGWLALFVSALGTCGLTLAGVVAAIISVVSKSFGLPVPGQSPEELAAEIIELTGSFTSLMKDRSNRAAQRRFFFALVDAADVIQGCTTTQENGVVVIRYSGFAEQPVVAGV